MQKKISQWPSFSEEEAQAVSRVLLGNKVNYWTGNECKEFEKEFAHWSNTKYSIAVSNGTVAIEIALKAAGISFDDEVIVTPRSFIASVSSVVNVGARPIFSDVDLNSGNISASEISKKISKKTKAIICVHLAGYPCEMDEIMHIARERNIIVIEDCAQAHGAKYKNQPVGSIGHIGCFSFCQDKIMTTGGEGGMITTSDEILWKKMWSLKDHGKTIHSVYEKKHPPGYRWLHEEFGSNYRMTEMQATIGRIQLKKMKHWNKLRSNNANHLKKFFSNFSSLIRVPVVSDHISHGWYKFNVYLKIDGILNSWSRDRISDEINSLGTPCFSGSCSEIYLEEAFNNNYRPKKRLKNAKLLGETTLMFLIHPTISKKEIEMHCDNIAKILNLAKK